MRAAPGTVSVDRGRTKVAHRVERGKLLERQGAGVGAAAGERGWLETKSDLGSRE
jgi:hypothetical protein